ncbi:MAG: hypothetical protein AAB267_09930, partial [Candidatus Desantisbacteria bacterium]
MYEKWTKKCKILFTSIAILAFIPWNSYADIPQDVLDSGGGISSESEYVLASSIGQTAIGESTDTNNILRTGYFYGAPPAPTPSGVPIKPHTAYNHAPGDEFVVNIQVGDNANPVIDLFGVSCKLHYDT